MNNMYISNKQGISIIILLIIGSSLVLSTAEKAKKDLWLAIILAIIIAVPIVLIHSRLLALFPGKDLYDILQFVFGKFLGGVISIVYIWYSYFLGVLVLRVFSDFVSTVLLIQTPMIVLLMSMGVLCIFAVKEGVETIGRFSQFFITGIIILLSIIVVFLIFKSNMNHIRPILYKGIKPVVKGTFQAVMFPFTQTILLTSCFLTSQKKAIYKVYMLGLLIGGIILLIISTTDVLLLGQPICSSMYFPTYAATRLVDIKNVYFGVEIVITNAFVIGGFVKISMCLLSTVNGFAKLLKLNNYKLIVTPIGLLMINLSYIVHESVMEKAEFASDIYPIYALPFQVILPVIILIFAEIKKKS